MNLAHENLLQDLARMVVWYPFRLLSESMPPRIAFALFEACGDLAYRIYPAKRALLDARFSKVFPDMEPRMRDAEVRACFRNYYADRFIINLVPRLDYARICTIATLEGEEHLQKALDRGRGAVLIHSHFGPSQLPLIFLGYKGYPMAQMGLRKMGVRTIGRAVDRLRLRLEHMMPVTHFFADGYLRTVLRRLKDGKLLMTAGDGTGGGRHIGKFRKTLLLGHPLEMPLGPYRLAEYHKTPIVPIIALREKCGFYRIRIHPPLESGRSAEALQDDFAAWLGGYLAASPGQWHFWDEWEPDGARAGS